MNFSSNCSFETVWCFFFFVFLLFWGGQVKWCDIDVNQAIGEGIYSFNENLHKARTRAHNCNMFHVYCCIPNYMASWPHQMFLLIKQTRTFTCMWLGMCGGWEKTFEILFVLINWVNLNYMWLSGSTYITKLQWYLNIEIYW